jgi:hypothetical protein
MIEEWWEGLRLWVIFTFSCPPRLGSYHSGLVVIAPSAHAFLTCSVPAGNHGVGLCRGFAVGPSGVTSLEGCCFYSGSDAASPFPLEWCSFCNIRQNLYKTRVEEKTWEVVHGQSVLTSNNSYNELMTLQNSEQTIYMLLPRVSNLPLNLIYVEQTLLFKRFAVLHDRNLKG